MLAINYKLLGLLNHTICLPHQRKFIIYGVGADAGDSHTPRLGCSSQGAVASDEHLVSALNLLSP
jgi:hypothetical protein